MASMQYAKEAIILAELVKIAENDKRTQSLELGGSVNFQAKSLMLSANLADALRENTKLTALNLSSCNLGDSALTKIAESIKHNSTLYELDLSDNKKSGRPGLIALGNALATNTGLITLNLIGHRIQSEVCVAFQEAFKQNMTLCKLVWKIEVGGYTLRFTELTNRNTEIDRCLRENRDYIEHLPREIRGSPPTLTLRVVPDPDDDDFGLEVGGAGQMVWCHVEGRWELGRVEGRRKRKLVVLIEEEEYEIELKDITPFESSHARDMPNMVHMQNLHEAPLLYLLQRRLKEGRIYTWAGDVLLALNPYAHVPGLYAVSPFLHSKADADAEPPPHVFSVAKRAYANLIAGIALSAEEQAAGAREGAHVDQSVLISGDSGAGKTEASKHVIEYLTSASKAAKQQLEPAGTPRGGGATPRLNKGSSSKTPRGLPKRASVALAEAQAERTGAAVRRSPARRPFPARSRPTTPLHPPHPPRVAHSQTVRRAPKRARTRRPLPAHPVPAPSL